MAKIRKGILLIMGFMVLLVCIVQAERKYAKQVCTQIAIKIHPEEAQAFVTEKTIQPYVQALVFPGEALTKTNTFVLQKKLQEHPFIAHCSVYKNWKGCLNIIVAPKKIISRIVCPGRVDRYIDLCGNLLPWSSAYTARVMLVESEKIATLAAGNIKEIPEGGAILSFLLLIDQDPFWRAQCTYVEIEDGGEIRFSTQFSRHKIYFGPPEQIEEKMLKLKLFYQTILPHKGWNKYKKVDLRFCNQIVCE